MPQTALLVGNSDGIGLAATKRLLAKGWNVIGVSRSASPLEDPAYRHHIADVTDTDYSRLVTELARDNPFDLCLYLAGIGEPLDPSDMSREAHIIEVNLTGMVHTAAAVMPRLRSA